MTLSIDLTWFVGLFNAAQFIIHSFIIINCTLSVQGWSTPAISSYRVLLYYYYHHYYYYYYYYYTLTFSLYQSSLFIVNHCIFLI